MEPALPNPRTAIPLEMTGVLLAATLLGLSFNAISPLGIDFKAGEPAALVPSLGGRSQSPRGNRNETLALAFEAFVSGADAGPIVEPTGPPPQKSYLNQ